MTRMIYLAFAVVFGSALLAAGAHAQGKASPKCAASYKDQCYKACSARGGQIRLCASYCEKQQRNAGCY